MNKRQRVIIFGELIHEHLKIEKEVDSRNSPQIVRKCYKNLAIKPKQTV